MTHKQTTFKRRTASPKRRLIGRWLTIVTTLDILIVCLSAIYYTESKLFGLIAIFAAINAGLLIRFDNKVHGLL